MQKKRISVYALSITALLTAVSIILSNLSIMIPLFGFPALKFSISRVPLFFIGALFGPVLGGSAGFIIDMVSFMTTSTGVFHFGFTLNTILLGVIPGIIFSKKQVPTSFNKYNLILAIVALAGALIYINYIGIHTLETIDNFMGVPVNVALSVLMVLLVIALIIVIKILQTKFTQINIAFSIDKILFVCSIQYLIVNLILTPYWLNQVYNIPFVASSSVRVFKSIIDIPLQVSLIYILGMVIVPVFKGKLVQNN
ncbi:MAG: hypothetical protein ATN36_02120 [Epulopiscium sp. Nele67-Bin005]|nr:MAG: hypothetical protein ATN36_02120 [Epulopiscium sp. Nele67-Bin005]